MKIFTIGHSTRPLEDFIALLHGQAITRLVDIRTMPRSRFNPQFNIDSLPAALAAEGITYHHLPGLGGLRPKKKDSINTGWRNASFRAYADYMQTQAFVDALNEVIQMAVHERITLMCAEAVPWRCHRSLVADALLVRDMSVEEITHPNKTTPHTLTSFACREGHKITYPAQDCLNGQLF